MILKYSFLKVEGDSMSPSIPKDSFVLIKPTNKYILANPFVFNHPNYGKLIKKLVLIDSQNQFWFEGEFDQSISMFDIGPIKKTQIIGRVVLSITKNSLKFFT